MTSDSLTFTVQPNSRRWIKAVFSLCAGVFIQSLFLQAVLESQNTATTILSLGLWEQTIAFLGGNFALDANRQFLASVPFNRLLIVMAIVTVMNWLTGAAAISMRSKGCWKNALLNWGFRGWLWWVVPGVWEIGRLTSVILEFETIQTIVFVTPPFWLAVTLAGWLATFFTLAEDSTQPGKTSLKSPQATLTEDISVASSNENSISIPRTVWIASGLFVISYTLMNWQLYFGLLVPHGDSAMYEEHLWNVVHGKGFRSYLDPGLFLGEHIQVIHLLLIPFHLIWSSHLLLELCETFALAAGTIPIFWVARRHTGSDRAAFLLAVAYLLYFPLQYLDIAIDLKTFRPISFGVPLLLFAIDQFERRRIGTMIILLLFALSAKEDYALVLAPLGLWIAVQPFAKHKSHSNSDIESAAIRKNNFRFGISLAAFSTLYLVLVVAVIIPLFRDGETVHYAGYFSQFGETPGEIVTTIFTNPVLVMKKLLTVKTVLYAIALLVPLGLVPLLSPSRLCVGLPLFVILCLNQVAQDPRHHFHAPLVPILFWAAAAGLGKIKKYQSSVNETEKGKAQTKAITFDAMTNGYKILFPSDQFLANFIWTSAFATGIFFSLSPFGMAFWDVHSNWHWRKLYIPGNRAEQFKKIFETIPENARVASTDFIHPRFTHHERSYDYSHYRRRVSSYKLTVPPDTDYIVIDTQHPYSDIKKPDEIHEYREHPDLWELVPDTTNGYFIVLKRNSTKKRND